MNRHTDSDDGLIVGVSANRVKAHMPYLIWNDGRMANMRWQRAIAALKKDILERAACRMLRPLIE